MVALGLVFGILILWLGIFAGVIFLCGFGLYRMAQHAGIPSPWLAFLPVAQMYVMGLLAERSYYVYSGGQRRRLARWTVISQLALAALAVVIAAVFFPAAYSGEGEMAMLLLVPLYFLLFLFAMVLSLYCTYYIFKDYTPDNAVLFTVIGMLAGITMIFFLVERDTVPVSVTGFGVYPYGRPKYDRYHRWHQQPPQPPAFGGPGPNTTGPEWYGRG